MTGSRQPQDLSHIERVCVMAFSGFFHAGAFGAGAAAVSYALTDIGIGLYERFTADRKPETKN